MDLVGNMKSEQRFERLEILRFLHMHIIHKIPLPPPLLPSRIPARRKSLQEGQGEIE